MTNVRKEIQKAMRRQGKSRYWLAQQTGLRVATVYAFIDGKGDVRTPALGKMLDALDLEIRPKAKR